MRDIEVRVVEYLLNAAWQAPLVFAAAWIATRLARRTGSAAEHRIWVGALMLEAVLPGLSVQQGELLRVVERMLWLGSSAVHGAQVTVTVGPGMVQSGVPIAPVWLMLVTGLYGASVLYFAVRLGLGLYRTAVLRDRAEAIELTGEAARSFQRMARMFGVGNARVAASESVYGPVVIGRVLLLPPELQRDIPQEDLDAALAHEFAHMRRHDFAKNLLYELLALPVAFHPVLWLTRRRVAESRELLCDAMAADAVQGEQRYARSLLRLASSFSERTRSTTIHAIGMFDANSFANFERRVMNLTEKRMEVRGARRIAVAGLSVLLGCGACASALALRMHVAGQQATQSAAAQNAAATAPLVVALPRPKDGAVPAQSFLLETKSMTSTGDSPAPERVRVLSPTTIETSQAASDPMQVSGSAMAGNVQTKVTPVYPQEAKDAKIQGTVLLDAVIDKEGSIASLKLVSGPDVLAKSAWEAVKQWKYKPFLLNGNPVEVETTITVTYHLAEQP